MEQKKRNWKDVYNKNSRRRFCEVTGVKEENVTLEAEPLKTLKKRKYIILACAIIFLALIICTFRSDIKILFIVLAFFLVAGIGFFVFNYFSIVCAKDGLVVRFGLQAGKFPYNRVKGVFLSKFNDYTFLLPTKRAYSVVIRYVDTLNRIRELSFPNYFVDIEDMENFLDNFEIKEKENNEFVQYERFKILKILGKAFIAILCVVFVIAAVIIRGRGA